MVLYKYLVFAELWLDGLHLLHVQCCVNHRSIGQFNL